MVNRKYKNNVSIWKINAESLGVKEEPYWDFVEVDNYICPILHNQINLRNNVFHNLLDYGNANIEKISVDEDKALKNIRRNNKTQITNISHIIINRGFRIEELSNKREIFSKDVSKTK